MAANNTASDPQTLHRQLLRPPVLEILRAAGFTRARPAVLDTVIDLTYRYLALLATHTASHAQARSSSSSAASNGGGETEITITDIRKALRDVGALYPQLSEMEELASGEEDMRGVEAFLEWAVGDTNAEIRRIAGMSSVLSSSSAAATALAAAATAPGGVGVGAGVGMSGVMAATSATVLGTNATGGGGGGRRSSVSAATAAATAAEAEAALAAEGREDYVTRLKKKHSKTGEESRWQGTLLGKDMGEREVIIEGWEVDDLKGWARRLEMRQMGSLKEDEKEREEGAAEEDHEKRASGSSSPLSEMTGSGLDSGFG